MLRIKYYSSNDLSIGDNLLKCEKILKHFDENKEYSEINDVIELYNISLFFESEFRLLKWSDDEYEFYKEIANKMKRKVYIFFNKITNDNFKEMYENVNFEYKDNFWTLFEKNINKLNISEQNFNDILNSSYINIYNILCNKKTVERYDKIIKDYLINNVDIAVDVLVHLFILKKENDKKFYIPNSLTNDDKVEIILKYINLKQANLNYLKLLLNVSDSDICLDVRIRKKIKDKIKELEQQLLKNGIIFDFKYQVCFAPDLKVPVKMERKGRNINILFDLNWIKNNLDYPTILNNFIYLFGYVDDQFRWNCVTKKRDLGLFETIFTLRASNDYFISYLFRIYNYIANMEQTAYYNQLSSQNVKLERVIEWFFNDYLCKEFGIKNFNVSMSSNETKFLEKCRNDFAELEGVLKKYNFYAEDGYIDQELVTMSTKPIPFENIKSVLKSKYIYVNDKNKFENICFALFSDQCMLKFVERINDRAKCFYELILKNEIYKSDIRMNDKYWLDLLVKNNLIYIENDIIKIKDSITINILKDLYENEVLNYWRLNDKRREKVDLLIENGLLKSSSSLLSVPESDFLNYILNNKYSNSLFLRNMYLHVTQPVGNEEIHKSNYMIILRLFILVIIKINDELCLKEYIDNLPK